jgi:co-chaperonin GroES (HSP10)
MKLKATKGKVIVKRLEAEDKIGSIYVPDIAKKKPQFGIVVAMGKCPNLEGELNVGDKVFFVGAIDKFQVDGVFYHTLSEDHVEAVVND